MGIEFKDVSFSYGSNKILNNISFNINKNESVGIIGANGVGKSTLLKLMVGLVDNYEGKIVINDLHVEKKNLIKIRKEMGYVFQDAENQLFMPTVYDDVAFALKNYGYSNEEVDKYTLEALREVNIENLKEKQIYRLSGGEKKLVSIAVVLAMKPNIILLDEPSITLDPKNRRNLIHILNEMRGIKIIASHDLDLILDTCERTIFLFNGKIIKDGKTKEILNNKELLDDNGLELPLSLYRR